MEESKSMSEGSTSLDVSPDLMLFVFGVIQFSECFRIYFLFGCLSFRREIFLPPRTFMKEHGNATNHDSRVNMKTYLSFVAHNELEVNTARERWRERRGEGCVCDVGTFFNDDLCVSRIVFCRDGCFVEKRRKINISRTRIHVLSFHCYLPS